MLVVRVARRELTQALVAGAREWISHRAVDATAGCQADRAAFGIQYSAGHIWHLLRGLGFSCQRSAKRALQRDEAAIQTWRTKRWPTLKKRQSARANHPLHRRVGSGRAADVGAELGAGRVAAGYPVQLPLEAAVGIAGISLQALLSFVSSRARFEPPVVGVPQSPASAHSRPAADHLGSAQCAPQPSGACEWVDAQDGGEADHVPSHAAFRETVAELLA
jgi:hypothetical protein